MQLGPQGMKIDFVDNVVSRRKNLRLIKSISENAQPLFLCHQFFLDTVSCFQKLALHVGKLNLRICTLTLKPENLAETDHHFIEHRLDDRELAINRRQCLF